MFERKEYVKPYEGKIDPFKIIGNVYFVGTFQASCHLIDTGDGLILIDLYEYSHINKFKNDKNETYDAQVSVLRIADVLFFTAPMELFTEYAKRIYAQFEDNMVVDVQLSNDTLGYLPTKEAIERGGYSTDYFSRVTTPEGGEYFIKEIKKMLNDIK